MAELYKHNQLAKYYQQEPRIPLIITWSWVINQFCLARDRVTIALSQGTVEEAEQACQIAVAAMKDYKEWEQFLHTAKLKPW